MILGSPYERLVAVNGKPLRPDQDEEQRKLDAVTFERQHESPLQREREREGYPVCRLRTPDWEQEKHQQSYTPGRIQEVFFSYVSCNDILLDVHTGGLYLWCFEGHSTE